MSISNEHQEASRRDRSAVARWALAFGASIAALLIAEFLVRLIVPSSLSASLEVPGLYRVPHPVFGWALKPGANYINPLPEGPVQVGFNSRGWRDLERDEANPQGHFRIAVLGDSFMEGYSANLADSFHLRLEQSVTGSYEDVEVLNFGVGGYGTLQEYLVYESAASRYHPDVVLLGFCVGNDVRNNSKVLESKLGAIMMEQRFRPFLEKAESGWEVSEVDLEAAQGLYEEALENRQGLVGSLSSRSALVRLVGRARTAMGTAFGGEDAELVARDFDLAVNGVHYCDETPEYREAWDLTSRIIERLRDEVESSGGRLIVFSAPTQRETTEAAIAANIARSPDPSRICLDDAAGNLRLGELLGQLNVEFIDLLPEFRRISRDEQLFHASDRHWTARGNAVAAELVAEALAQQR